MAQAQSPSRRSTPGRQSRIDPERKISVPRGQPAGVSPTSKGSRSIQVGRRGVLHSGVRDDPAVHSWPLDRTGSNRSSIGLVNHRPRVRKWMPPGSEKGTSLNSSSLTPKPLAPSVYVIPVAGSGPVSGSRIQEPETGPDPASLSLAVNRAIPANLRRTMPSASIRSVSKNTASPTPNRKRHGTARQGRLTPVGVRINDMA